MRNLSQDIISLIGRTYNFTMFSIAVLQNLRHYREQKNIVTLRPTQETYTEPHVQQSPL